MPRRSLLPPTGAFFTLPHGSLVHLVTRAWTPERLRVSDEWDLVPYRELQAVVDALHGPLAQRQVAEVMTAVPGCRLRWAAPPQSKVTPLPRPAAPDYGSLTGYLRGTPEARQAIRTALTRQAHPAPAPMLAPPLGANPGLVGTAFDYAFRLAESGFGGRQGWVDRPARRAGSGA
ncbi:MULTISPECIES: hypothetical protein [Deinococcus]|uniref:hypothetical protein n=1 Tax=Deinococcus TaxID=1298 RepID=UPI0012D2B994|nr:MULTISPECIES: hypothetical protein [Deinococcus]